MLCHLLRSHLEFFLVSHRKQLREFSVFREFLDIDIVCKLQIAFVYTITELFSCDFFNCSHYNIIKLKNTIFFNFDING